MSRVADALDPLAARERLGVFGRLVTRQTPTSLWERDTALLPAPLGQYRRRVRDFARRELWPRALPVDLDPESPERMTLLRVAARAGLLTDWLPRPLGTGGAWALRHGPILPAHLRLEELSAACPGLALHLVASELGLLPLLLAGELGVVRRFVLPALRRTAAGDPCLFSFAITEPDAGSDVQDTRGARSARLGTHARPAPGGFVLSGRKCFITGGDVAERFAVFAARPGQGIETWTCFVVEADRAGLSIGRHENKLGQRASAAVELILDDVFVPADHVVGGLDAGWALCRATLDMSRGPVGAIALGIARGALEAALAVASRTIVAGRPLVEHDDVALAFADMILELSATRSLLWQSGQHPRPAAAHAAVSKAFAAESAWRVCQRAMDVLGDAAMLHENRVEKALRDVRLNQIYEGTDQIARLALVEAQLDVELSGG